MPISKHSTLVEMKDYIRKHPQIKIKLGQKKSLLLAALDKEGHIHTGPRGSSAPTKGASPKKATPKKATPTPKKATPTPKKATPKKAGGNTVAGQLLDLDMDVGKKIGEAVKQRKFTLKMKYSYGKAIGKKRAKKDLERGNDYQDFAAMGEGETDWEIIKKEREGFTAGYKEVWGKRTPKKTTIKSRWKKVFKSELDGAVTNSSRWSNMSDKYIRVVVNRIRKGEKIKDVLDNIASMIRHGEIHNSEW
jgi:DNA-directed RNA polymerase beta' subunit